MSLKYGWVRAKVRGAGLLWPLSSGSDHSEASDSADLTPLGQGSGCLLHFELEPTPNLGKSIYSPSGLTLQARPSRLVFLKF
jgi:hypothetical protein